MKGFSYSIVFKQCAERICSDRIKRGIDTELTAVTQNLFDNPEKPLLGRGSIVTDYVFKPKTILKHIRTLNTENTRK